MRPEADFMTGTRCMDCQRRSPTASTDDSNTFHSTNNRSANCILNNKRQAIHWDRGRPARKTPKAFL